MQIFGAFVWTHITVPVRTKSLYAPLAAVESQPHVCVLGSFWCMNCSSEAKPCSSFRRKKKVNTKKRILVTGDV